MATDANLVSLFADRKVSVVNGIMKIGNGEKIVTDIAK